MRPFPPAPTAAARWAVAALLSWVVRPGALAADPRQPADAIQLLVDITLIDRECRNATVDFGRAFQVAATMGVRASDVMPTGPMRPPFEAAIRHRRDQTPLDQLCTEVAGAYADHIPGLLKLR